MDLIVSLSLVSYFHCISYTITIWVENYTYVQQLYYYFVNFVTAKQHN